MENPIKKYALAILMLYACGCIRAQTTISGSLVHDGLMRTYSFYVPASYNPDSAVPLVIGLHGLGSSGAEFAQYRDFRSIADSENFIVAHPDGSSLFGIKFWNYGSVLGSTVDDVGFIEALIDAIAVDYNINPQRIYAVGMSNGSFMAYYMACQSNRFAAIGAVTGSMSINMYNSCSPSHPTPSIHIHGTEDAINPYNGTSTMQAVEDVCMFWVDQNECSTTPSIFQLPDTDPNDNAIVERHLYTGGINDHTVEFFKVIGGGHSWPGSPMPGSTEITCMDFDACQEIWRFLSQYEIPNTASLEDVSETDAKVWPNPTQGVINIQIENHRITNVTVFDMQGRTAEKITKEHIQHLDLSHLSAGNYILEISGIDVSVIKKLTISR